MKTRSCVIAIIGWLIGIGLLLCGQGYAGPYELLSQKDAAASRYVAGEVLVKFRPTATLQARTATVAAQGHSIFATLDQPGWVQVRIGAGQTVAQAVAAYRSDPRVEYVQPNYIYHIAAAPNDTQYDQLWAFKNTGQTINNPSYPEVDTGTPGDDINIESAWDHITDCRNVVVAVLDTGINYNQQDLAGNMWDGGTTYPNHGYDYVSKDNDPMDLEGHGTHVAGIIGAMGNNANGTTGVCWTARIMGVRIADVKGFSTTALVTDGVNFAVTNGAKVINMSLSGGPPTWEYDEKFDEAITNVQSNDVVVVVAAGNDKQNNDSDTSDIYPVWPCNFTQPNLLCVAALDQNYDLATFSNFGSTSVDVGAPGTNILSTYAGTNAIKTDPLTSGWTFTTTTTGGWDYGTLSSNGDIIPFLFNPANWPNGQYNNSTDDRAYKTFNLAGIDTAKLFGTFGIYVRFGDRFRIGYSNTGSDPFAGGTILVEGYGDDVYELSFDVSDCIGASCSVGFQLETNASLTDIGVAIGGFGFETLTLNTTTYNNMKGTSMATPMVAGLAAMLRAYNPQYTYADVVNSIKNGGRATASLDGITTTGKAIDVISSLAYIASPTGLTATVE